MCFVKRQTPSAYSEAHLPYLPFIIQLWHGNVLSISISNIITTPIWEHIFLKFAKLGKKYQTFNFCGNS